MSQMQAFPGASRSLATTTALDVSIVDGTGAQITSFGGGTQYTEGDVDTTVTGTAVMWEDTGDTMRVASATKPLPVNIVTGSSSGTQYTEDAAAAADPVGTAVNLIRKDTPATITSADGDNVAQRGTNYGAAYVQVVTSSGSYVDSFGGGTQYTEDVAAAADPVGTMGIMVRADSLAAVTSADGDNIAFRGTNKGELYVKQSDAVPVTDNSGSLTVDNAGTFAVQAAQSGTWTVQPGNTANTTAWKVDGSAVTQPVSGTVAVTNAALGVVGGGVEATALRVTLASDSTGLVSVDDNGGSLTVDGTVASTQSGTWTVQPGNTANTTPWLASIHDGTTKATVRELGANDALNVAITDSSGNQISTFGGGTQFADGAARSTATGTLCMVDDGTNIQSMSGDSSGRPNVNINGTVTVDTELPAAAALADATSNPTTTNVGSEQMVFNGTTWDRSRSGTTTPSSTFTGMQNTMPWAKYDSTPTARTTGQGGPLQADVNGALQINSYTLLAGEDQSNGVIATTVKPIAAATYSPSLYSNLGASTAAAVKASAGNVFSCSATNTNASVRYLQLFNRTTAPTAATAATYTFLIPASGMITIGNDFWTAAGAYFSSGIAIGLSTTAGTYTAATAGDHMSIIHYI